MCVRAVPFVLTTDINLIVASSLSCDCRICSSHIITEVQLENVKPLRVHGIHAKAIIILYPFAKQQRNSSPSRLSCSPLLQRANFELACRPMIIENLTWGKMPSGQVRSENSQIRLMPISMGLGLRSRVSSKFRFPISARRRADDDDDDGRLD